MSTLIDEKFLVNLVPQVSWTWAWQLAKVHISTKLVCYLM
jgi:hypothetical protein